MNKIGINMDAYHYITIVLGIINMFLVLVIMPMRTSIKENSKELQDLRTDLQTGYMSKTDFKDHLERIEKALDEVKSMLLMNTPLGKGK